ncbi:Sperm-specific antigen 2, partial [Bienertia sinuspersici]
RKRNRKPKPLTFSLKVSISLILSSDLYICQSPIIFNGNGQRLCSEPPSILESPTVPPSVRPQPRDLAARRKVFPGGTKQATSFTGLWQRPPAGVIKVNVDAHMGADGKAGLGAVMRDENGVVLLLGVRHCLVKNVEQAEAMAVRYGIMLARRFGFQCIMVESDAANVVNIINSRLEGYSSLHIVYDDIGFESLYFQFFSCTHVRRVGNTVAHLVARLNTMGSVELICMSNFPQSILTLAENDLNA